MIDRNGYSIDHDFFGHAVTATPEIGAAESDVIGDLVLRSVVYQNRSGIKDDQRYTEKLQQ